MFAKTIVLSDAFLDLPMSARCLYFTLGMLADDDGFVNSPRSIMRQCGASDDDMKILIAKKFVLLFDSGVIVIKHWRINNYLRSDRYNETKYIEEKSQITADSSGIYHRSEDGIPSGIPNTVSTDKVRLGKDSIGKDSIGQTIEADDPFETFWNVYPKKVGKEAAREAFSKCTQPLDLLINAIEKQKQSVQWNKADGRFIPNPATWLTQGRWSDEVEPFVGKATATADSPSFRKDVAKFMSEEW